MPRFKLKATTHHHSLTLKQQIICFQVVANAWLETLLDAIDLLPPDVIKREIVVIAVNKAQIEQSITSKKAACRSVHCVPLIIKITKC